MASVMPRQIRDSSMVNPANKHAIWALDSVVILGLGMGVNTAGVTEVDCPTIFGAP
jgi:hypothetical protein